MPFFVSEEKQKDLKKEKHLIDREVELYRREKESEVRSYRDAEMAKVTAETAAARNVEGTKLLDTQRKNVVALQEAEHEYHSAKETKNTEIVKLYSDIKAKEDRLKDIDDIEKKLASIPALEKRVADAEGASAGKDIAIDHLKQDVTRLDEFVKFIAGLLPKVEFDKLSMNFNTEVNVAQPKGQDGKKEEKKPQA